VSSHRIQKVNELIKQELGQLILKEINTPHGCLITITKVDTSKDLGQAKVMVSILPISEQEPIMRTLHKKAGFLQYELGKKMVIRKLPKLIFYSDLSQEKVSHIDTLIDKIHREK